MNAQGDKWGVIYASPMNDRKRTKRWGKMLTYMREKGVEFDYVNSDGMGSVERLTEMFVGNGYRTIVIVGGDSSVGEAVNVIMRLGEEVRSELVLGVIPNGNSNDYASFWGFSYDDYEKAIDAIIARKTRKIDVGVCLYRNEDGEEKVRCFVDCLNLGLTASIIKLRRQAGKFRRFRFTRWIFSSVMMTFERIIYRVELKVDDQRVRGKFMSVCVGNMRGYGQTPSAVPYNGLLDVSLFNRPNRTQLLHGGFLLLIGHLLNHKSLQVYRGRKVSLLDVDKAKMSADGRLIEDACMPMEVTVKQECLEVIC